MTPKISRTLLVALLAALFIAPAFAQPPTTPITLTDESGATALTNHLETVWTSREITLEQVSQQPFSPEFLKQPDDADILWARVEVKNATHEQARWVLRSERFLGYGSVEIYRRGSSARFDGTTTVSARELRDVLPSFRIELAPQESQIVYLRIEPNLDWDIVTDPAPMLMMFPEEEWVDVRFNRLVGQSAFFTFLLVTILYQILTVIIEVDRSRMWYISLLASYIVYFSFLNNFSAEFFPPYLTLRLFAPVGLTWMLFSYAGFVSTFLELRETYPRVRRALFNFAWLNALIGLFAVLYRAISGLTGFQVIIPLTNLVTGALVVTALGISGVRARDGYRPARLLLAASGAMGLSGLVVALAFLGVFSSANWAPTIFQFGCVAECLILSVAVTNRLRFIRKDKEKSLVMLEQQIKEVQTLKTELDHQLAARSRELTQVLAVSWSPTQTKALSPGDLFESRYQIIKQIGKGGMGTVFMVERTSDQKKMALKTLLGATTGIDAARFTREAEISARMTHPNLVKLFDVGLSSGSPYFIMEFIEGGSLDDHRSRYGEVQWALPLLLGIARGLGALHQANIVHRDLKPSNVLLDKDGTPKIADFGISRYEEDQAQLDPDGPATGDETTRGVAALAKKTPELTAAGAILGTPRYMPPEAANGARMASPAWDIFSFGVMAYEMLTGQAPFAGVPIRLALQGRSLPPIVAPLEGFSQIPRPVAIILTACLSASPSDRPSASILEDCLSA